MVGQAACRLRAAARRASGAPARSGRRGRAPGRSTEIGLREAPARPSSGSVVERSRMTLKSPASTSTSPGSATLSAKTAARSSSASATRQPGRPVACRFATVSGAPRCGRRGRRAAPWPTSAAHPPAEVGARREIRRRKRQRVEHDRILGERAQLRLQQDRVRLARERRAEEPLVDRGRQPAERRRFRAAAARRSRRRPASRSSRRGASSAQTGSSCRQSTSGRSSVASRIICSRKPCRSGGLALPWKTFQVRTSRLTRRASLGRCCAGAASPR